MKDLKKSIYTINFLVSALTLNEILKKAAREHMGKKRALELETAKQKAEVATKQAENFNNSIQNPIPEESNQILDQIKNYLDAMTDSAKQISNKLKTVEDLLSDKTPTSESSTLLSNPDNIEKIQNAFKEAHNISQNLDTKSQALIEIIDNFKKSKGSGSSQFIDSLTVFIQNIQEYLSSLTLIQNLTILNISIGTLILNALVTIILIYYSDFLIGYFKLEEKFPKLSKYIKIRKKFQQFYFFVNVVVIIMAVAALIFANYLVFIYS